MLSYILWVFFKHAYVLVIVLRINLNQLIFREIIYMDKYGMFTFWQGLLFVYTVHVFTMTPFVD